MLHYAIEIEKTDVYEQKRTKTEGDVAKLSLPEYRLADAPEDVNSLQRI